MKDFSTIVLLLLCIFDFTQSYPQKSMGYLPTPSSNHHSSSYQSTPDYPFHQGYPDNSYDPAEHRGSSGGHHQSGDGVEIQCNIIKPGGGGHHNRRPENYHHGGSNRQPDDDCHRVPDHCRNSSSHEHHSRPDDHHDRHDDHHRRPDDYNKHRPDDYNRRPDDYSHMRHTREF